GGEFRGDFALGTASGGGGWRCGRRFGRPERTGRLERQKRRQQQGKVAADRQQAANRSRTNPLQVSVLLASYADPVTRRPGRPRRFGATRRSGRGGAPPSRIPGLAPRSSSAIRDP